MGIAATTAVGGATVTTAYSTAPSIVTAQHCVLRQAITLPQ